MGSAASDAPFTGDLFGSAVQLGLPDGFEYRADFVSADEEAALIDAIATLPLVSARYKGYTARRRIASYGTSYDFDRNRLEAAREPPAALMPLRARAARWIAVAPEQFVNTLVCEYAPGTPLGWHRDVADFDAIVGISLGSVARMRWRPHAQPKPAKSSVLSLELAPRSAYVLRGDARWRWQHGIAPTPGLRWSITFRTAAHGSASRSSARNWSDSEDLELT